MEYVAVAVAFLLVLGFFALLIIALLHLKNYKNLSAYLQDHYSPQWKALGEPGLSNASPRNVVRLLKFLTTSLANHSDANLERLITSTRKTLKTGIVIFTGEAMLFLTLFILAS